MAEKAAMVMMGSHQDFSIPPVSNGRGPRHLTDTEGLGTQTPVLGADFAGSKSFLLLITLPLASPHPLHSLMSTGGTRSETVTAVH